MQHTFQARLSRTCVALAAGFIVSSAFAHTAPLGEEGEIRYNFTANYGIAKRLEAPNAALSRSIEETKPFLMAPSAVESAFAASSTWGIIVSTFARY